MSGVLLNRHSILSNKLLIAMSGISKWTVRNNGYVYENHQYHISDGYLNQRWTKSAIRQFLAYVALSNAEGEIHFVSEEEVASLIHCSVRTIQENNKQFDENGIISVRRIWGEYLDVNIHNYKEEVRDLTFDESGKPLSRTGYTSIWHEVMVELFKIENINELRLALRCLLYHEKEVHVQQLEEAILSYDEIKGFLPKYVGYKKAIKEMTDRLSGVLRIACLESKEVVRELFQRQTRKRPSLKEKLAKPFALAVHLNGDMDSQSIKREERAETFAHWFSFKQALRGILPLDLAVPTQDLQSFSDTYGAELVLNTFNRLVTLFTEDNSPYLAQMRDEITASPSEFLARHLQSRRLAKAIAL